MGSVRSKIGLKIWFTLMVEKKKDIYKTYVLLTTFQSDIFSPFY